MDASDIARFWRKVEKNGPAPAHRPELGPCWVWLASTAGQMKYGRFWDGSTETYAHRVSWRLIHGPVPPGMLVMHRCDNVLCCNPDHLRVGTHADNTSDMDSKGRCRRASWKGSAHPRAKLTESDIPPIRKLREEGRSYGDIAKRYRVSEAAVWNIINAGAWKHA